VPPVKWPVQDFATGIDVEIRGALNCGEEAKASYNGGAQECIASCEAEVDPAGFVLALFGDQKGTAGSFGSPHTLPEGVAMRVGHVQEGALPRSEVRRWVLCLLQRDLVEPIARRRCFSHGLVLPVGGHSEASWAGLALGSGSFSCAWMKSQNPCTQATT
jgi:hypothetical protein